LDAAVRDVQFESDSVYKERLKGSPVSYVSMIDRLCPKAACRHFDKSGWPILIDDSHLSLAAAAELISEVKPDLLRLVPSAMPAE
jgi:hypothetical protein